MPSSFSPEFEILPLPQQKLWPDLEGLAALGFVLYGGTAIALRLGHRVSVDFDFFSKEALNREAILKAFPRLNNATTLQDVENSWSLLVPVGDTGQDTVKVSFFGGIAFGRVGTPEFTEDNVLLVASLDDLMATKLKVLFQRSEAKDYRDIAAMLQDGADLAYGLAAGQLLFGNNFQPSVCLKALVFFEDGDLESLSNEEREILVSAVNEVSQLPEVQLLSEELLAPLEADVAFEPS